MEKDNEKRFNMMKSYFGLTDNDISEITGLSTTMVQRARSEKHFSKHNKLVVWVFEKLFREINDSK